MRKEFVNYINKIKLKIRNYDKDKENTAFFVWLLWMAGYYGCRMFRITPWYDELYTYYYFISRGPIYAAIHWPLPNNHVGYSVLSGLLDLLGNPVIGLRGISYICALANLILLYHIGRKSLGKGWSFCAVVLYSCMNLVNQLAVQGRGYTLATTCCLMAVLMLQRIGFQEQEKKGNVRYYVIFSFSLTLGLYVLPSSVYWVLPLCMLGGSFLLLYKKWKSLLRLVISSVAAAVNTVILYAIIWLAIGSNLLSKAEGGSCFGKGHVQIICSAPLAALREGMGYMLATPYIQSVERKGYLSKLAGWFHSLMEYFYPGAGSILLILIITGVVLMVFDSINGYKKGEDRSVFISLYLLMHLILTPLILILQCKLPYFRVFSYMGIPIAVLTAVLLQKGTGLLGNKKPKAVEKIPIAAVTILGIVLLWSKAYNSEYGMSEYYVRDVLSENEIEADDTLCVTDCYQQYLLKFYKGITCESTEIEGADWVLLHKEMTKPDSGGFRWEFYHSYDTIPWAYINKEMAAVYENEEYILYRKK